MASAVHRQLPVMRASPVAPHKVTDVWPLARMAPPAHLRMLAMLECPAKSHEVTDVWLSTRLAPYAHQPILAAPARLAAEISWASARMGSGMTVKGAVPRKDSAAYGARIRRRSRQSAQRKLCVVVGPLAPEPAFLTALHLTM